MDLTQLADSLAADAAAVLTARAQQPTITPVDTTGVNKPVVVAPSTFNWRSPYVLGAAGLAAALALVVAFRPRRRS